MTSQLYPWVDSFISLENIELAFANRISPQHSFAETSTSSRLSISCYFGRHLSETRDVILVISPSCVSRNEQSSMNYANEK